MKFFITGGSGILGKELVKYLLQQNHEVLAPTRQEFDITGHSFKTDILKFKPDYIIHAAALVDTLKCEHEPDAALHTNVYGTYNFVNNVYIGGDLTAKFVYISTEYVFDGRSGNYYIDDMPNPINVYGKTKLAAENIVSILPNYQIIRAPFIRKRYNQAFVDQFCNRYFVEELPEKIINNIIHSKARINHISNGVERSLYKHYIEAGIEVDAVEIPQEYKHLIPKRTSLVNTSKW